MLDPVLLESFLAVAQARSFSEAGRRLNLRQSTISQHIRRLEQEAGRRLFVRDTHSVVPTADGESDIASMIDAVSERSLDQLEDDVRWVEQVSARIAALSENDVMMSALDNVNDRTHYVRTIDLADPERSGEVRRSIEAFSFALQKKETPAALAILKRDLDAQIDRMPTLVREGINRAYTSLC